MVRTFWRWRFVRGHDRPEDYARKVLVNRHRSLLRRAVVRTRHAAGGRCAAGRRRRPDRCAGVVGGDPAAAGPAAAVVVLRFQEDLSEAEVARLLQLPLGAVKSTSRRALARLREQLGPGVRRMRHHAVVPRQAAGG
jgi:hypothetical protein